MNPLPSDFSRQLSKSIAMSDQEKISAVPDTKDELALADGAPAASSSEAASDVEALPQTKQLEYTPRGQRRGLLSSVTLVREVQDPYQYSNGMKWLFTAIVAFAGTTSSTASSILYRKLLGASTFKMASIWGLFTNKIENSCSPCHRA